MEVVEFRGQWVPKKVIIINGTSKREFEIQWKSLNEPLDEKTFELDFEIGPNE